MVAPTNEEASVAGADSTVPSSTMAIKAQYAPVPFEPCLAGHARAAGHKEPPASAGRVEDGRARRLRSSFPPFPDYTRVGVLPQGPRVC
jgi:hypothetical protein